MPSISIHTLHEITGSNVLAEWQEDQSVTRLLIDSRKLTIAQGTLFIAIPGRSNDGHRYVLDLYQQGVRHFLVSSPISLPDPANVLLVKDSIHAFQDIAAYHRSQLPGTILAITGSNGKTIIKEWLFHCMSDSLSISRSPKSYNSQLGVPLSVWMMEAYHELGIIEAGISMPGEMAKLQHIIKPDIGIFSNIGPAHGEHFNGLEHKVEEKLLLFHEAKTLIFCSDHQQIVAAIDSSLPNHVKRFSWGRSGKDLRVKEIIPHQQATAIQLEYQGLTFGFTIPFRDHASVENALHTCAAMLLLGQDPQMIGTKLSGLHPLEMRLEMKDALHNCALINDSYSADLVSFAIALDFLQQQDKMRDHMVILSEILQSDMPENLLYQEVARQINGKGIRFFVGIGKAFDAYHALFPAESVFFHSTEAFLENFAFASLRDRIILLKGARAFGFERIASRLQLKVHETSLLINLQAIVHNLNYYRSLLHKDTRIMAMVKAFGYGSGSWEIAGALQFHRVDYLAVAYVDEGISLREAGIDLPIMVMNPNPESMALMLKHGLEPEIYSMGLLEHLIELLPNSQDDSSPIQIHIKLDTGMHRLGFMPDEISGMVNLLKNTPGLHVASVFSHMAASEDPAEDAFSQMQASRFHSYCLKIKELLGYSFLCHILNTAGISRFPEYQFDMVRPGIGLYGFSPSHADQAHLENVMTLRSVISQLKSLEIGDTVGYNRKWTARRKSIIGIVPVGYADGIDRRLGQGRGEVVINGQKAPLIGSVCMDMIMIDVTGLQVSEGDEVILFGEGISLTDMAKAVQTIPYEILTGISARVKRVYYNE